MAHRSLRHRTSRFSSPATFGEKEPAPPPAAEPVTQNGQQRHLDVWLEPPLRPPAPSFEDTKGLERVGVLENMQPLGTAPSQRLLQKLKLSYARPSPRATPAQTAEEVVTPATEPAEKMELASPTEEAGVEQQPDILPEIPPSFQSAPDTILISSPPRGRPPGRQSTELQFAERLSPSPVRHSFSLTGDGSPKPLSIQQSQRQDRLRNHVSRAIQEAEQKNTPDLVNGLQQLRADAHFNYELWNVVEAMMNNSPSPKEFKVFKRYIKSGVKRHRRDSQISGSPYQPSPQRYQDFTSPDGREGSPKLTHAHGNPPPLATERNSSWLNRYTSDRPLTGAYGLEELPVSPSTVPPHLGVAEQTGKVHRRGGKGLPHKRKRSGSFSTSSLSSIPSNIDEELAPPSPLWEEGEEPTGSGRSDSAGQRQATGRSAAGSRLRSAATNHLLQPTLEPGLEPASRAPSSKRFKKAREEVDFDIDELSRRKRVHLDDSFHDYNTIPRPESDEREIVHGHPERPEPNHNPLPPIIHPDRLVVSPGTSSSLPGPGPAELEPRNGAGRKRTYYEVDADDLDLSDAESSSPDLLLAPPPPPGVARATSRAATPRATRVQPATTTRKSARVMISPNKPKNGGITAGIARAGAGAGREVGGHASGAEDNDEFCTSCHGEGVLLCCDGCTNSFHHACLEPPLNPNEEIDGEWLCPACVAREANKGAPSPAGLLGRLLRAVDSIIPKAYNLPHEIRDYFEGVRTGDEGEYEEVGLPRTQNNVGRMNRAGFIEEPNYKETRDSKGNMIRCYHCNTTSNGRDIIPCDFCPAKWHLDCLDPPLAVPPRRRAGDKPSASWRCPLHIDQDLLSISRQAEKAPGDLGRIPKPRKPKNAIPLDIATARGFRNNGVIEVELMKDQPDLDKMKEVQMNGRVYRVPEMGIRLDFIDRVKKSWYEDQSLPRLMDAPKRIRNRKYRPDGAVLHHPPQQSIVKVRDPDFFTGANALAITETAKANVALRRKSLKEQQTVLNLAQMSQRGIDGYSGDTLAELTNALISEAPDKVVRATEKTERDQLLQLQELISKRLSLLTGPGNDAPVGSSGPSKSNGALNGTRNPSVQDPNLDPALRGGGFAVLPPVKALRDQDLPIDPALQTSAVSRPSKKLFNGDSEDYSHDSDDDDDDEDNANGDRYLPVASAEERLQAAWLANREQSQRWLDGDSDERSSVSPPSAPEPGEVLQGYAKPSNFYNHPVHGFGNANGHGNGNGNGVDTLEVDMEMD